MEGEALTVCGAGVLLLRSFRSRPRRQRGRTEVWPTFHIYRTLIWRRIPLLETRLEGATSTFINRRSAFLMAASGRPYLKYTTNLGKDRAPLIRIRVCQASFIFAGGPAHHRSHLDPASVGQRCSGSFVTSANLYSIARTPPSPPFPN